VGGHGAHRRAARGGAAARRRRLRRQGGGRGERVLIWRIVVRYLLVWGVNAASLALAAALVPGLWFDTGDPRWWIAAVLLPVWFSLGILLLRPLLVLATLPLNAAALGLPTLLFNGLILYLVADLQPAFHVESLGDAFLGLILFTVINTAVSSRLGIDEVYPFFQTILKRVGTRYGPRPAPGVRRGLIILQVDGLAWRSLVRAVRRGRMPALSAMMGLGTHRLRRWQAGVPSNTPVVQSGLFYGTRGAVPGYRWYDRAEDRVRAASSPSDLRVLESTVADGRTGLLAGGSCINSLLGGGAEKKLLTLSAMKGARVDPAGGERADVNLFWLNPWAYSSAVLSTGWEFLSALVWTVISRFQPRKRVIRRSLRDAAARAVGNAFLRETAFFWLEQDVARGVPVIYSNFVGYDEVAHHAGPDAGEALATLTGFDRKLQRLRRQLQRAPLDYDLVLLSDHGQSACVPFRVVAGRTLEDLVDELCGRTVPVWRLDDTEAAYVDGLLEELDTDPDQVSWLSRRSYRTLARLRAAGPRALPPPAAEDDHLIVCVSGGLAHLYQRRAPRPLGLEEVRTLYPGLVEGLVSTPGIAVVAGRDRDGRPLAVGRAGVRHLATGQVVGETDPMAVYGDRHLWSRELARLAALDTAGDLVILADRLSERREVTFEEQVGTHGGVGGPQNEPFLLIPSTWRVYPSDLNGPEAVHTLLKRHLEGVAEIPPDSLHSSGG